MTNFLEDLIFPIIYTIIGAGIGGWFAYKIAKDTYHGRSLKDINGVLYLMNKTSGHIVKQSKDIHKHLSNRISPDFKSDIPGFFAVLLKLTQSMNPNISAFLSCWERYGETIQLCCMKDYCRNPFKRKKYEKVTKVIEEILFAISMYKEFSKQYETMYNQMVDGKWKAHEIHSQFQHEGQYDQASNILKQLSENCELLQSMYAELNI